MSLSRATIATLLFLSFSSLTACDEEKKIAKGEAGESCTKRQDCGSGLNCIDNRCVSEDAQAADGGMTTSGGKEGESCTRRADCRAGLACVDQVCQTEMLPVMGDAGVPGQRGERGETCTARNDCKAGLGCVGSRCVENNYDLTVQPKECYRVECEATADCCANFVPSPICPTWKSECDMDPILNADSCQDYAENCNCNLTCVNETCEDTCASDNDCGGFQFCVSQRCVQCKVKADCPAAAECIAGECRAPCTRNEQCPLLYSCSAGKCVEAGCKTDRECFFLTEDPRSTCVETECVTPCDTDAECAGDFEVCDKNRCVFVGCENNDECRSLLRVQNAVDSDKAVCRAPTMM